MSNKANRESAYLDGAADLNALTDEGEYWSGWQDTIQNTPVHSAFHLSVKRLAYNEKDIVTQEYVAWTGEDDAPTYRRNQKTNGWGKWELVSTATPPQEYDLPLAAGAEASNVRSTYWKNQFGEVGFDLMVKVVQAVESDRVIATLPAGYRPATIKSFVAFSRTGSTFSLQNIQIAPGGGMVLYGSAVPAGSLMCVSGVFLAA